MYQNAIALDSPIMESLKKSAKTHGLTILFGCNEKISSGKGNSSLYNSIITINTEGVIANHHRKLMPTFSLICWEHWMPLTRQAMHDQAEDIHFALWPHVIDRHLLASRHYAFEGRCYVVAVGQVLRVKNFPKSLEIPELF